MPRFFFVCEGAQSFDDAVGTQLPDLRAAQLAAIRNAGEILADHPESFAGSPWWRMTVLDGGREPVFVLTFSGSTPEAAGVPREAER